MNTPDPVFYPDFRLLSDFEKQSQTMIALAFALCESKIRACHELPPPELLALSAAALSLEKAVAVFIAVERLSK